MRNPFQSIPYAASLPLVLGLTLAGCSATGPSSPASPGTAASTASASPSATLTPGAEVVLLTHESFALPKDLIAKFEKDSGQKLKVQASGDAGTLATKISLSAGNPQGDVAFGIDNSFASRPIDAGAFAAYAPKLPAGAEQYALKTGADQLTPIDTGDVCVNVDKAWFEKKKLTPPATLDDLLKPEYKNLYVTPGAATSSPGMAFLLTTIAAKGDGWPDYWTQLKANGAKIVAGWEDAYFTDFTGGSEKGTRPIVLSYDSSPAFTVSKDGKSTSTAALLDTCFAQVEYAGVLKGAKNPAGAQAFVDFLLSPQVQAALPDNMYVYPVDSAAKLPQAWATFAPKATKPYAVDPADITKNRENWLSEWNDIVTR